MQVVFSRDSRASRSLVVVIPSWTRPFLPWWEMVTFRPSWPERDFSNFAQVESDLIGRAARLLSAGCLEELHQLLGLPDREAAGYHLLGGLPAGGLQVGAPRMAWRGFRRGSLLHQSEQILRKSQQTQGIGNGRAGFSHPLRYLLPG